MKLGLQPYRDILNPLPPCWKEISLDWYKSLLKEAEEMEIPKTCDTCKWRGEENPLDYGEIIFLPCHHPALEVDASNWEPRNDGTAQAGNDAGYVSFMCGPKFGCIHWESK